MPQRTPPRLEKLIEIGLLERNTPYYVFADEPKIPASISYPGASARNQYFVDGVCGFGTDRNHLIAQLKARAECVERLCLANLTSEEFERYRFHDPRTQIDPAGFICYTAEQIPSLPELQDRCREEEYLWWPAEDHATKQSMQVPLQLVSHTPDQKGEFNIRREQTSTGAALGPRDTCVAFQTGLLECVERDGCIAAYLTKFPLPRIVDLPRRLDLVVAYLKRYRLEPFLFDATSDLGIPTILAITLDRTGVGPAVTSGSSAQFNYADAIEKALLESLQSRAATRVELADERPNGPTDGSQVSSATHRTYFWFNQDRIPELDFLLNSGKVVTYSQLTAPVRSIKEAVTRFAEKGWNVLEADLTLPEVWDHGFEVKKVLVPQLHPYYQDEAAKALFSQHYGNIANDLTLAPHPMF